MKLSRLMRSGLVPLLWVVVSVLGCGAWAPVAAMSVDAYMPPQDASRDVVFAKRTGKVLSADPVEISLGAWVPPAPVEPTGGRAVAGHGRPSPKTASAAAFSGLLRWKPSAAGGLVAAVSFRSDGAKGLRVGLLVDQLPGGALLRVYTKKQPEALFEYTGAYVRDLLQGVAKSGDTSVEARTWWAPSTEGEEVTLEIELPRGAPPGALVAAIPTVVHIHVDLGVFSSPGRSQDEKAPLGGSGPRVAGERGGHFSSPGHFPAMGEKQVENRAMSCHKDANCEAAEHVTQRRAVARMSFFENGSMYLCSGTLLNDRKNSGTPYFLTAHHCIHSDTAAATLETRWFYWSTACGSRTLNPEHRILRGGADLLHSSPNPDIALLRLKEMPPPGALFAGWDSSALATGSQILGIHHPQGDMQKMSFGKVSHRASCFQVGSRIYCYGLPNGNYYFVDWNRGLIEGGSSGSGLFHDGRLMGALSGGSLTPSCSGGNVATYASLESAFPALRQWLALPPEPPVTPGRAAVYRLFNTQTGAHFFTSNAAERDFVLATYPVFRYENIAFYAGAQPKPGLSSVYRFYNPASGAHFYTISEAEREYVRSAFPVFQYEGPAWYGSSKPVEGMVPVFRFYNPSTGAHFYTNSPDERDFVIATYPVFQYEGVAYYVWNTP